ncbi:MAG: DeoR/GlpR transcriptional regulator [Spirochaetae bacterium HGW-Spirochaetae-8]|jgi:DeoR/GlpR family transcriptional regulator of sugar metabolism|nr:MAG: DeoR/GlpR transcriptional regulator [Spirochaetae bacterium HGW-Spirochaetae-8]
MTANERQKIIINTLKTRGGIIKVNEIARQFDVSNETARRDIEYLKEQGLLTRVYGGAILSNNFNQKQFPLNLDNTDVEKKTAIAKAAAAMVKDGESIFVGIGSTMLQLVRNLKHLNELTVITPSLSVAMELTNTPFRVIVLGGILDSNELDLSGPLTLNNMDYFHVNKAFLGAGGVTVESGVSDYNPNGYGRHAKMSRCADTTILVAQSDKFGKDALSIEMPLTHVTTIITDDKLTKEMETAIRETGKELVLIPLDIEE